MRLKIIILFLLLIISSAVFGQDSKTTQVRSWHPRYTPNECIRLDISTRYDSVFNVRCNGKSVGKDGGIWWFKLGPNVTNVHVQADVYSNGNIIEVFDTNLSISCMNSSYLLSVGTGDNPIRGDKLKHSLDDAKKVHDTLYSFLLTDFEDTVLLNSCNATACNILKSLDSIEAKLKNNGEGQTVFVYLSGHGEKEEGFSFQVKSCDSCVDSDYINRDSLTSRFKSIAKTGANLWIFIDACKANLLYHDLRNSDFEVGGAIFFAGNRFDKNGNAVDGVFAEGLIESFCSLKSNADASAQALYNNLRDNVKRNRPDYNLFSIAGRGESVGNLDDEKIYFKVTPQTLTRSYSLDITIGTHGSMSRHCMDPLLRLGVSKFVNGCFFDKVGCFAEIQYVVPSSHQRGFGVLLKGEDLEYNPSSLLFCGAGIGLRWQIKKASFGLSLSGRVGRIKSEPVTTATTYGNVLTVETMEIEHVIWGGTPSVTFSPPTNMIWWKDFFVETGYSFMFVKNNGSISMIKNQKWWNPIMLNVGYSFSFPSKKNHNGNR